MFFSHPTRNLASTVFLTWQPFVDSIRTPTEDAAYKHLIHFDISNSWREYMEVSSASTKPWNEFGMEKNYYMRYRLFFHSFLASSPEAHWTLCHVYLFPFLPGRSSTEYKIPKDLLKCSFPPSFSLVFVTFKSSSASCEADLHFKASIAISFPGMIASNTKRLWSDHLERPLVTTFHIWCE